jgi:hypothetical protein
MTAGQTEAGASAEQATGTTRPAARLKAILGGAAGNLVEWYDWFAYSSFTLYFAPHFFPKGDTTAQLLQAAAVFAVGFLARPFGAWLMGLYADRAGRRFRPRPSSGGVPSRGAQTRRRGDRRTDAERGLVRLLPRQSRLRP